MGAKSPVAFVCSATLRVPVLFPSHVAVVSLPTMTVARPLGRVKAGVARRMADTPGSPFHCLAYGTLQDIIVRVLCKGGGL